MADWSQLPKDLLHLISTHLVTATDLLRFRSVCTTWRSSTTPKRHRFPNHFPNLPNDLISTSSIGFHLSKRTIFLITLPYPRNQTPPWLIKIEQNSLNINHLLNPLSDYRFNSSLPPVLDLSQFRIRELGHEFVLQYLNPSPSSINNLYMEKVVMMMTCTNDEFLLLTIHVSGKLVVFKSGDKKWSLIDDMKSPYDDVILYKGDFYGVDNTGRIVKVLVNLGNSDLEVELVADSVFGGDRKHLVELEGELLLVDMYLSVEAEGGPGFAEEEGEEEEEGENNENYGFCVSERTVRFKVYRLDEGEGKWEEVKSLGDGVVFLGEDCSFCVSGREIGEEFGRGNCVVFVDNLFGFGGEESGGGGGGGLEGWGIGVFDLESGSIGPLRNFPEFGKLIWPPPQWITETTLEVSFALSFCFLSVFIELCYIDSIV